MTIQFLWDEEKTRKFHKTQLILNAVATVPAIIFAIFASHKTGFEYILLIATPTLTILESLLGLYFINKPNQGLRFLLTNIFVQTNISIYMVLTGGFLSISAFASYVVLTICLFQLGIAATIIMAGFSVMTFLAILIWLMLNNPYPELIYQALFYITPYLLIVIMLRQIGKEISIQFQARKQLEAVDDLKNQFITLTSHYLRTPLTVIKGTLDLLSKSKTDLEREDNLTVVRKEVRELEELVEKFLTLSMIEKGKLKLYLTTVDIQEQILETISLFKDAAKEKGVYLTFEPPALPIPGFKLDHYHIKQVLIGLVDNAIKFNKKGGEVRLKLSAVDDWVEIRVEDTGIGIEKDHLESLFNTFNRGGMDKTLTFDNPGIGLSLYLSKLIIESHNGSLKVESTKGQGSVFTIRLPFNKD
jgi:signal transduction histidine kinase